MFTVILSPYTSLVSRPKRVGYRFFIGRGAEWNGTSKDSWTSKDSADHFINYFLVKIQIKSSALYAIMIAE